jgi:hypothetical protein
MKLQTYLPACIGINERPAGWLPDAFTGQWQGAREAREVDEG